MCYLSLAIVLLFFTFIMHSVTNNNSDKLNTISDKQREAKRLELLSLSEDKLTAKYYKPWRTLSNY